MKYFEVTFSANPCNETITDILSALTAEAGFESFVECEGGMQAYIQQSRKPIYNSHFSTKKP